MVDIVKIAYALGKAVDIVDGGVDIVSYYEFRDEVIASCLHFGGKSVFVITAGVDYFFKNGKSYFFAYCDFFKLFAGK